jgi:hypothetical protein
VFTLGTGAFARTSFTVLVIDALIGLLEFDCFVKKFQHSDTNLQRRWRFWLIRSSPAFFWAVQGIG